ncbi:hypothetical protein TCAL_03974 [Tigriopus californicus]|uniref:WSC domain-containing protein n=1 Tax=Tigriopus californicus TaxID=6832 RepID=A0A553PTR0_TIGCA|nr:uncharacterized protein LOC131891946 [Tigriopus californicus]TRY81069.1 hypothetical protein TCAL_03974 [Tigriopus californicus]|eukprot:TCALIF_03974-PA protein Name:"Protein of unknown function" AED:0.00 eAED:0.00 QI:41/1/1/1/1/1/2/60/111
MKFGICFILVLVLLACSTLGHPTPTAKCVLQHYMCRYNNSPPIARLRHHDQTMEAWNTCNQECADKKAEYIYYGYFYCYCYATCKEIVKIHESANGNLWPIGNDPDNICSN